MQKHKLVTRFAALFLLASMSFAIPVAFAQDATPVATSVEADDHGTEADETLGTEAPTIARPAPIAFKPMPSSSIVL